MFKKPKIKKTKGFKKLNLIAKSNDRIFYEWTAKIKMERKNVILILKNKKTISKWNDIFMNEEIMVNCKIFFIHW